jgi:NitT/TauT family transport system permease protein
MWAIREQLLRESIPTTIEIWLGFFIAFGAGFLIAIPIAYSRLVEETVFPILVAFQVVPKVALAPLFLIWLGFGMVPKVAVAALIAFFPIVVNTVTGLRSVEQEMVQWMRTLGAKPWEIFFRLSLPWALPYIMAALKVSIGLAVVGAVVGEFIGTDRGLGYIILRSTSELNTPVLFGALITISLIGIISYAIVTAVEKVLLSWQTAAEAAPETM